MALTDALIIIIVFITFGILILSRLRQKNPQGYDKMISWIKDTKNKIPKNISKKEEPSRIKLPDDSRIM